QCRRRPAQRVAIATSAGRRGLFSQVRQNREGGPRQPGERDRLHLRRHRAVGGVPERGAARGSQTGLTTKVTKNTKKSTNRIERLRFFFVLFVSFVVNPMNSPITRREALAAGALAAAALASADTPGKAVV